MISKFLREQKRYTQKDLCDLFECTEEKAIPIIRKLKEFGILKAVKFSDTQNDMSDLIDEDIEVADVEVGENEFLYVFTFVGVITVAGRVLKSYPKYIFNTAEPKSELKQVLKVLEKYNSKEQIIRMFNESSESHTFNLLAVLIFLLHDYYENGTYINTTDIIESNGLGEILWDKTINETFILLSNNRPYYTDLQTRKRITNDFDYFKRLHECILSIASKELKDADLLDLFEIAELELSGETLDDFGDEDYILYRIEQELNVQFNTHKQLLLKTIYAYVSHGGNLHDTDCLSMFGTNSFNLVWESVCSDVMDNQLQKSLGSLTPPISLKSTYDSRLKLIDLIEKPLWSVPNKTANNTLIPDLVTIIKDDGEYKFIIFDAKYYNAQLEYGKPPKAQPGIESVTKQYLYQLAYQKFVNDHNIKIIKNCFLMPTELDEIIDKGTVSMGMLDRLELEKIQVRCVPAKLMYSHYLEGSKIDISSFKL
jgi:hypothetical protein